LAFADFDFKVWTGYLGGFIVITDLTSVAISHTQSAYTGLQKSLQQEWQFVQRVVKGIGGDDFSEMEKAINDLFLPSLFADQSDESNLNAISANCP
jgi:hypothetical protein